MLGGAILAPVASADEADTSVSRIPQRPNTVWALPGAFLAFLTQAGFGILEAGSLRAKGACRVLTKDFFGFSAALPGLICMSAFVFARASEAVLR